MCVSRRPTCRPRWDPHSMSAPRTASTFFLPHRLICSWRNTSSTPARGCFHSAPRTTPTLCWQWTAISTWDRRCAHSHTLTDNRQSQAVRPLQFFSFQNSPLKNSVLIYFERHPGLWGFTGKSNQTQIRRTSLLLVGYLCMLSRFSAVVGSFKQD